MMRAAGTPHLGQTIAGAARLAMGKSPLLLDAATGAFGRTRLSWRIVTGRRLPSKALTAYTISGQGRRRTDEGRARAHVVRLSGTSAVACARAADIEAIDPHRQGAQPDHEDAKGDQRDRPAHRVGEVLAGEPPGVGEDPERRDEKQRPAMGGGAQ